MTMVDESRELAPGLWLRGARPRRLEDFRLAVFDMDSTLVATESLDELAGLAGCQAEVAAITEAAMRGELADYGESLRRRVALLRGLPEAALDEVYTRRMPLMPGAEALLAACRAAGLRCVLATGGFTCFTDRLAARLGLHSVRANVLETAQGVVTGRLLPQPWGELCDGEQKKRKLLEECEALGVGPQQAIAVGDGANDLAMMGVAGLSVAYRAKPRVRAAARAAIDEGGLDRLLELFADARPRPAGLTS